MAGSSDRSAARECQVRRTAASAAALTWSLSRTAAPKPP